MSSRVVEFDNVRASVFIMQLRPCWFHPEPSRPHNKGCAILASISREPNGHRSIQFKAADGKRRTIRLGKVNQKTAEFIKTKVEALAASLASKILLDQETARWVGEIGVQLASRLAAVGLTLPRENGSSAGGLLGPVLDEYLAMRTDVKPNTMRNFKACRDRLVEFLGANRTLASITPGDADAWVVGMAKKYAKATIGVSVKRARQFFRAAVRSRLLAESPFADVKSPSMVNRSRQFFVSQSVAKAVLEACPDNEWRLIFALCRYGGLRCPSELLPLRWIDVDWERSRFLVHAPKTEHHEDGGERGVPIFPELRRFLVRHREDDTNLRTNLTRIIRKAGHRPWPKLFQNLRSTRETELAADFPIQAVCAWIGHSVSVAEKHYLQVTEDLFERAAKPGAAALQNPVQPAAASLRDDSQKQHATTVSTSCYSDMSSVSSFNGVPPIGLEPITR